MNGNKTIYDSDSCPFMREITPCLYTQLCLVIRNVSHETEPQLVTAGGAVGGVKHVSLNINSKTILKNIKSTTFEGEKTKGRSSK